MAGVCNVARGADDVGNEARLPALFLLELLRTAYRSAHCSEGLAAYNAGCATCSKHGDCDAQAVAGARDADLRSIGLKVVAQVVATGVGGRIESLYPVPDDLLVDPRPRDAVWAQPAYLETVAEDVVQHDEPTLRLLVPSSRNPGASTFDAWLTRKGVRVWAERKPQRLSEGEHYFPAQRLFDIDVRIEDAGEVWGFEPGMKVQVLHLRTRPGIGLMATFEIPDGRAPLPLPATVSGLPGSRAVRIEATQYPQPTLDVKPKKKWRLCVLSDLPSNESGLPPWIDSEGKTAAPLPEGGKLVAIARRRVDPRDVEAALPATVPVGLQTVIPSGTTYFVEYEEPVRIDPTADVLAGGS